jgi:hypothetical protein
MEMRGLFDEWMAQAGSFYPSGVIPEHDRTRTGMWSFQQRIAHKK